MSHRLFLGLIAFMCLALVVGCAGTKEPPKPTEPDAMEPDPPAPDEDRDGISDEDEGRDQNVDTDGDGTPDYLDDDSDNDTIRDIHEGTGDPDGDGTPNFRDLESDRDCRPDMMEAGDSDPQTPPRDTDGDGTADAYELDSDGDGLADYIEDANCNGMLDDGETDALNDDTDGDGASDLIEVAAETDPRDPNSNPQALGNFVFVVPYNQPALPERDDLDFSTNLKAVDLYFMFDLSGSMANEVNDIKNNVVNVLTNLTCAPNGTGDPETCIPDLWAGAGTIGYPGPGGEPYGHLISVQPNPQMLQDTLTPEVLDEPSCSGSDPQRPCDEVTHLAMWSALTGQGSQPAESAFGCSITDDYGPQNSCAASPAGPDGVGYPCFRPNALPVVVFATDESHFVHNNCPTRTDVVNAANAVGAKIVGVAGNGSGANMINDMEYMAQQTGAIDYSQSTNPPPIVIEVQSENQTAMALENGIRVLANGVPLDIAALAIDDPFDPQGVDAVTAFIDRLETQQLGTNECSNGLADADSNGDGAPDRYLSVLAGTPVCWSLVPKMNTTIEPSPDGPQLFRATIQVTGNDITTLDTRDVFFLVPPSIVPEPIE